MSTSPNSTSAMKGCYCNVANEHRCCVADCRTQNHEPTCFPCHTWRGNERCLHTGQLRADKEKSRR